MTVDLGAFPCVTWPAGRLLHRIHREGRSPWWFSCDGDGRFDLTSPDGTSYWSETDIGAWVEVYRTDMTIADTDVDARRLNTVRMPRSLRLADLTDRRALEFGITADIGAGHDYTASRQLASDLHRARFDGVRWWLRHDPAQELAGVALFGSAGAPNASDPDWPLVDSEPLDDDLVDRARAFGYRVVPAPAL